MLIACTYGLHHTVQLLIMFHATVQAINYDGKDAIMIIQDQIWLDDRPQYQLTLYLIRQELQEIQLSKDMLQLTTTFLDED